MLLHINARDLPLSVVVLAVDEVVIFAVVDEVVAVIVLLSALTYGKNMLITVTISIHQMSLVYV